MKTTIKKDIEVILTLTQIEAFWLKSITQNSLYEGARETEEDEIMRKTFFNALPTFQELKTNGRNY